MRCKAERNTHNCVMDFSQHTIWWILSAVLVAIELATGTFYLLMLAVGAACGAIAAHLGLGPPMQMAVAAATGVVACLVLNRYVKSRAPAKVDAQADRNVNLDVGERISVTAWSEEKTARAMYRGAEWFVRFEGDGTPQAGEHRIVALEGNRLVVRK
jgi:membrane protein implicated in regulation of membrane protease activity